MYRSLQFVFLAFVFLLCSQCTNNAAADQAGEEDSAGDKYTQMAKAMCACLQPMADKVKEIENFSNTGQADELEALLDEMESLVDEAEECADREAKKFGEPEDEQKANEALSKECPEIAQLIGGVQSDS